MTILSIVTALVLGFVLFGWLQLGALISVIAAIGTFIILSLILRIVIIPHKKRTIAKNTIVLIGYVFRQSS